MSLIPHNLPAPSPETKLLMQTVECQAVLLKTLVLLPFLLQGTLSENVENVCRNLRTGAVGTGLTAAGEGSVYLDLCLIFRLLRFSLTIKTAQKAFKKMTVKHRPQSPRLEMCLQNTGKTSLAWTFYLRIRFFLHCENKDNH